MKQSKKDIESAIIIVGESLGMKQITELLLVNVGIYTTIKELTFVMFIENKQQYFERDYIIFESISLIREYCKEMSSNGEVSFDISYSYVK